MDQAPSPPILPADAPPATSRGAVANGLPPLPELGHLARGLTVLFWALPLVLVIAVLTAQTNLLGPADFLPALLATGLLVLALHEMRRLRPEHPPWRAATDRGRSLALAMTGLTPFLHWWQLAPRHLHYEICGLLFFFFGLLFLANLAFLLRRAAALLAQPPLEDEARLFLGVNLPLLAAVLALALSGIVLMRSPLGPRLVASMSPILARVGFIGLLMLLITVALNMTLVWKLKQAVFDAVFQTRE